ncbi:MAG: NAD(P)/FAD-dependent oxidoreductase [Nitrospira sp.]|nr:NAD(P)/FAD-dependent oxidoreductase [Nitrospira sp.]
MYQVDEVVIGAGLTGLVYANVAASNGLKVAVIEKHTRPGGYATNFMRKGANGKYVFDCSLHKITGLGVNGNLQNALERSGLLEHIDFHYYQDLTTFILGNTRITLPSDGISALRELKRCFPKESAGLDKFFSDIQRIGYFNYMFARMALGEYSLEDPNVLVEGRKLSRISTYQYFTELFKDPTLITLLCAIPINLGVEAYEADALYFLHFAYTFFMTDKGYVKGSSQKLSNTLAEELKKRGGELFLNNALVKIDLQNTKVVGVQTSKQRFMTNHVVFTGCPNQIVNLVPFDMAMDDFHKKLAKLHFGLGAFIVYLGLLVPPSQIGITEPDYLIADEGYLGCAEEVGISDIRYQRWPLSISNYHALDPNYGFVVQLEMLEQQDDWFELSCDDYKAKKRLVAEKVIDRASRYFSGLKEVIDFMDVSTPRTNMKYTNSGGGSSFGYKPKPGRNVRFLQNPPIEGIQFVGTWVSGAGYEPAMCLGFTAATLRSRKWLNQSPGGSNQ